MSYSQETDHLQDQLSELYDQQNRRYEAAAKVANEIAGIALSGSVPEEMLEQMNKLMNEIESADRQINPQRMRWDSMGISANPRLKKSVERLRITIGDAMDAVANAEARAKEAKHRLAPHLGSAMTARRMVKAYDSVRE